jgi:hypothetical protein
MKPQFGILPNPPRYRPEKIRLRRYVGKDVRGRGRKGQKEKEQEPFAYFILVELAEMQICQTAATGTNTRNLERAIR